MTALEFKNKFIGARITRPEYEKLMQYCKLHDTTPTTLIRELLASTVLQNTEAQSKHEKPTERTKIEKKGI